MGAGIGVVWSAQRAACGVLSCCRSRTSQSSVFPVSTWRDTAPQPGVFTHTAMAASHDGVTMGACTPRAHRPPSTALPGDERCGASAASGASSEAGAAAPAGGTRPSISSTLRTPGARVVVVEVSFHTSVCVCGCTDSAQHTCTRAESWRGAVKSAPTWVHVSVCYHVGDAAQPTPERPSRTLRVLQSSWLLRLGSNLQSRARGKESVTSALCPAGRSPAFFSRAPRAADASPLAPVRRAVDRGAEVHARGGRQRDHGQRQVEDCACRRAGGHAAALWQVVWGGACRRGHGDGPALGWRRAPALIHGTPTPDQALQADRERKREAPCASRRASYPWPAAAHGPRPVRRVGARVGRAGHARAQGAVRAEPLSHRQRSQKRTEQFWAFGRLRKELCLCCGDAHSLQARTLCRPPPPSQDVTLAPSAP